MTIDPKSRQRGMSLIEVMISFAILGIAILGLVGGLVVASTANGFAATRTQMSEFAQSRLEQIAGQDKHTLCSSGYPGVGQDCSEMGNAPSPFNPDVAANTGGWMMDVIDWPPPTSNFGDDVMYGPVVVLGDSNAVNVPATLAARATAFANWTAAGATGTGCDSAQVVSNPGVLCREIHIEKSDSVVPDGGTGSISPMLHVWVRVLRGGTTDWHVGTVLLQEDFAQ